jgi:hypothetical protein
MKEINHNELRVLLERGYEVRTIPMLILGRTAIGKSDAIKRFASDKAAELGKELLVWNDSSVERKKDAVANPDKYFGFVDVRLAQSDPTDLKGFPSIEEVFTVWRANLWVKALEKMGGVLFFDEINLAPPLVQSAVYQVLLDRQVGETPLSDGVYILGAGNLAADKAATFKLPKPIVTRLSIYELKTPSVTKWTEWAIKHDVDNRIVSFLQWRQTMLFSENDNDVNIITPRGWEYVSKFIDGIDDPSNLELYSAGVLGEGGAIEFVSFVKLTQKFDLDEMLKAPTTADLPVELSQKYALIGALASKAAEDPKHLEAVFVLANRLPPEFGILLARMVKHASPKEFADRVMSSQVGRQLTDNMGRYL